MRDTGLGFVVTWFAQDGRHGDGGRLCVRVDFDASDLIENLDLLKPKPESFQVKTFVLDPFHCSIVTQ